MVPLNPLIAVLHTTIYNVVAGSIMAVLLILGAIRRAVVARPFVPNTMK
jgi:hypothetical protein